MGRTVVLAERQWKKPGRPKTVNELRNLSKRTYVCEKCRHQHVRRVREPRPEACEMPGCGHKSFIFFRSGREAQRFFRLDQMQRTGFITNLKLQVPFPLVVNEIKIADYVADFTYEQDGRYHVEDVKPERFRDNEYKMKAKLMRAVHNIIIEEIER